MSELILACMCVLHRYNTTIVVNTHLRISISRTPFLSTYRYVCIHIQLHTCMSRSTHIHVYAHTYLDPYTHMHTHIHLYNCFRYACIHIHIIIACACACASAPECVYVHLCIMINMCTPTGTCRSNGSGDSISSALEHGSAYLGLLARIWMKHVTASTARIVVPHVFSSPVGELALPWRTWSLPCQSWNPAGTHGRRRQGKDVPLLVEAD